MPLRNLLNNERSAIVLLREQETLPATMKYPGIRNQKFDKFMRERKREVKAEI